MKLQTLFLILVFGSCGWAFAQSTVDFSLKDSQFSQGQEEVEVWVRFDRKALPDAEDDRYRVESMGEGHYRLYLAESVALREVRFKKEGFADLALDSAAFYQQLPTFFLDLPSYDLDGEVEIVDRLEGLGERIPVTAIELDAKDISLINAATSADLLQSTGDVFVQKSQMGGGSPNIRGFEANKVLIVVDGVRLNNAIFRGGHLQNVISIDQNMLEKVEVLFGPGSVMFGSDALGGVMHFLTRQPKFSQDNKVNAFGNAFLRTSSANFEKTAHLDYNLGGKRFASLSSVTVSDFDDLVSGSRHHRDYPDFGKRPVYAGVIDNRDTMLVNDNIHRQRFSGYRQIDVLQKFKFQHRNPAFSHGLNVQYSTSTDVPRFDRLSEFTGDELRYAEWYYGPQERLAVVYKGEAKRIEKAKAWHSAALTLSYQQLQESRHTRRFNVRNRRDRTEQVQVGSANLDAQAFLKNGHQIRYGLEGIFNDVRSEAFLVNIDSGGVEPTSTRYPDGGSQMFFLAGYVWDQFDIIPEKLTFTGGFRLNQTGLQARFMDKTFFPFLQDEVQQSSFAPSGSAGLALKLPKAWKLRMILASGFRAPNVDDVAKTFDSEPGTVIVPNPDLKPEYTYNLDFGISHAHEGWLDLDVTGFITFFDNALQVRNFTLNGQDSIIYDGILSRVQALQNVNEALLGGFNFKGTAKLGRGISLSQSLTYTQGRETETSIPLSHIPPVFGRTELRFAHQRFQVWLFAMYNGWKRIEDYSPSGEDNQKYATPEGMPSWVTLNFKGSWEVHPKIRIQGGIENILNQHYRVFASGISAPGRNFSFTLRTSF